MLKFSTLLTMCALLVAGQGTKNASPNDALLHDQVSMALTADADVRGNGIQVDVKDGAVILRGKVKDEKAKEKATKLARKVKNVTSVDNQLKLADAKDAKGRR